LLEKKYIEIIFICMVVKKNKIITFKNQLLREKSLEVKNIDKEVKEIINHMNHIMNENNGIGLAAIQIGIPKRIITIDLTKNQENQLIKPVKTDLVNPVILSTSERMEYGMEGCLSVPGKQGEVLRHFWIELEGYTLNGEYFHKKLYDLAARVAQHEIDHINGILFIDKLDIKN